MKKRRFGIFGGTFNPPHIAHVRVGMAFVEGAELDSLLIIPTNDPPHKLYSGSVSATDRFKLCELAFSGIDKARVSDMEIARGGKSYTVETLKALSSEDVELYLLCGTDMFLSLDTWFMAEEIFKLATICFVRRELEEEYDAAIEKARKRYIDKYSASVLEIKSEVTVLSSTNVRERITLGDYSEIPEPVAEYIRERDLYT